MATDTQEKPITTPEAKEPSSFTELTANPEFQDRWKNGLEVTDLQKKGAPLPDRLQNPGASEESALEAALQNLDKPEVERPFKSEKANANWKKLKEENQKFRSESQKRIDDLTRELEAAKAGGANKSELEAIRVERDRERQLRTEFEDQLKLVAVERHPKFKQHFDAKLDSAINQAKQIGGAEHGERIADLLRLPESPYKTAQLDEIANSLGGVKAAMFGAVLLEYNRVQNERQAEAAKYRERYDAMVSQQQREQEEMTKQQAAVFEAQLAAMTNPEKGFEVFKPKQGDEAWNSSVAERLAIARSVFDGNLDPKERASISFWAAAAPEFAKQNAALSKEVTELRKQLEALSANKPKPGEGGETQTEVADDMKPGDGFTSPSVMARIAQRMGR